MSTGSKWNANSLISILSLLVNDFLLLSGPHSLAL